MLNIMLIGDIYGSPGRKAVNEFLPQLQNDYSLDLVIANGENAAGGNGLTPAIYEELLSAGIDVVTSGNHIWDKKEIIPLLDAEPHLLRPANYPPGVPGHGATVVEKNGVRFGIANVAGRTFMPPVDCPFQAMDALLPKLTPQCDVCFVDFHAEATSEKMAMGWHLDGRVAAVIGTHTHIQTADERLLPQGTAYLTDVGMTGPWDSVLGVQQEIVVEKFRMGMPARFVAAKGPVVFAAVVVSLSSTTGFPVQIKRVQLFSPCP